MYHTLGLSQPEIGCTSSFRLAWSINSRFWLFFFGWKQLLGARLGLRLGFKIYLEKLTKLASLIGDLLNHAEPVVQQLHGHFCSKAQLR